jgi:hypothetical protein
LLTQGFKPKSPTGATKWELLYAALLRESVDCVAQLPQVSLTLNHRLMAAILSG